jgi:uncharacterized protein (TIGR02466 family)
MNLKNMDNLKINIFNTPILNCKLNIDNLSLISYFYKLKNQSAGLKVSNEGGWHSDYLDLNTIELQPLIKNIKNNLVHYIKDCGFKTNLSYEIQSMWSVVNSYKDYNNIHNHPNCLFSGVYYVKTPENCGVLEFINPVSEINYHWSGKHIESYNNANSALWYLPIEQGNLYFFPSWSYHQVKPNLNKNEDRISISFNISVKDK